MIDSDSLHLTTIAWARGEWSHHKGKYSREHLWHFAGGAKLKASDSMAPEGYRDEVRLNPENLFVRNRGKRAHVVLAARRIRHGCRD